jgi:hypothetical protein
MQLHCSFFVIFSLFLVTLVTFIVYNIKRTQLIMKKTLLLIAALATTWVSAQAQTIANGSFETWTGPSGGLQIEASAPWFCSDQLISDNAILITFAGGIPSKQLYKSTDKHGGDFAAELRTKFMGDTLGNLPCALLNANLVLDISAIISGGGDLSNILNFVTYHGGTPTLGRKVDNVKAWLKTFSTNGDQSSVTVNAMQKAKTSANTDTLILIGSGLALVPPNPNNDYVETTVNVTYLNANNTATDTLLVIFASSAVGSGGTGFTDGNKMLVDDVTMTTSEGSSLSIQQPLFADDIVAVYPNPAKDQVYFNLNTFQNAADYKLMITDATGRVVLAENLKQQVNAKNVSGWAKGSYFYALTNVKNGKSVKGKFSVQ